MIKTVAAFGAIMALISTPVKAACWTPSEVAAAEVRDFDTMLMVSGLRCRFQSASLLETYNAVVVRHRPVLSHANMLLKAHFNPANGGANALDKYITRVANRYGAGAEGLSCDSLQSIAQAALAEPSTMEALTALAARADVRPELPDGICEAPKLQVAAFN